VISLILWLSAVVVWRGALGTDTPPYRSGPRQNVRTRQNPEQASWRWLPSSHPCPLTCRSTGASNRAWNSKASRGVAGCHRCEQGAGVLATLGAAPFLERF
jgi:hypothetical protein